jgi:hypothetical protein
MVYNLESYTQSVSDLAQGSVTVTVNDRVTAIR